MNLNFRTLPSSLLPPIGQTLYLWWLIVLFGQLSIFPVATLVSQEFQFRDLDTPGVKAERHGNELTLHLAEVVDESIRLPRLAAALRTIEWVGAEDATGQVNLQPEPNTWTISWAERPEQAAALKLTFDSHPLTIAEASPIRSQADGSFWLPAHLGITSGEKIRYEPQPFKNTIGYWVGQNDQVQWELELRQPGRFTVGILQGCGRNQGGSLAKITVGHRDSDNRQTVQFKVQETGHFQNFQWRHLGSVVLDSPGLITLQIEPIKIERDALMDVRAIHLVRVPEN